MLRFDKKTVDKIRKSIIEILSNSKSSHFPVTFVKENGTIVAHRIRTVSTVIRYILCCVILESDRNELGIY